MVFPDFSGDKIIFPEDLEKQILLDYLECLKPHDRNQNRIPIAPRLVF